MLYKQFWSPDVSEYKKEDGITDSTSFHTTLEQDESEISDSSISEDNDSFSFSHIKRTKPASFLPNEHEVRLIEAVTEAGRYYPGEVVNSLLDKSVSSAMEARNKVPVATIDYECYRVKRNNNINIIIGCALSTKVAAGSPALVSEAIGTHTRKASWRSACPRCRIHAAVQQGAQRCHKCQLPFSSVYYWEKPSLLCVEFEEVSLVGMKWLLPFAYTTKGGEGCIEITTTVPADWVMGLSDSTIGRGVVTKEDISIAGCFKQCFESRGGCTVVDCNNPTHCGVIDGMLKVARLPSTMCNLAMRIDIYLAMMGTLVVPLASSALWPVEMSVNTSAWFRVAKQPIMLLAVLLASTGEHRQIGDLLEHYGWWRLIRSDAGKGSMLEEMRSTLRIGFAILKHMTEQDGHIGQELTTSVTNVLQSCLVIAAAFVAGTDTIVTVGSERCGTWAECAANACADKNVKQWLSDATVEMDASLGGPRCLDAVDFNVWKPTVFLQTTTAACVGPKQTGCITGANLLGRLFAAHMPLRKFGEALPRVWDTYQDQLVEGLGEEECIGFISHRWSKDELTYSNMTSSAVRSGMSAKLTQVREVCRRLTRYWWIDTLCINKADMSELDATIRSMHRWYGHAAVVMIPESTDLKEWWTRAWCLQELVAAKALWLHGRSAVMNNLPDIDTLLQHEQRGADFWIAHAGNRKAERVEDIAYSLIGILDLDFNLSYGEGRRALQRLCEAVAVQRGEVGWMLGTSRVKDARKCFHPSKIRKWITDPGVPTSSPSMEALGIRLSVRLFGKITDTNITLVACACGHEMYRRMCSVCGGLRRDWVESIWEMENNEPEILHIEGTRLVLVAINSGFGVYHMQACCIMQSSNQFRAIGQSVVIGCSTIEILRFQMGFDRKCNGNCVEHSLMVAL